MKHYIYVGEGGDMTGQDVADSILAAADGKSFTLRYGEEGDEPIECPDGCGCIQDIAGMEEMYLVLEVD